MFLDLSQDLPSYAMLESIIDSGLVITVMVPHCELIAEQEMCLEWLLSKPGTRILF